MEGAIEVDMDSTIGEESCGKQGKKKEKEKAVDGDKGSLPGAFMENTNDEDPSRVTVSVFDYSVENHFRAMDMISKLCGESECECDQREIQRLSSSIIFLREWRHFCYQPRIIRFACQSETPQAKDVIGRINLPQFSAATVPKKDGPNGNKISSELSKDFIMYVGGLVWALDWCPRVHERSDSDIKSEFIAVAAHPPESSYHKIGAPLTGRGVIQIWCLLNVCVKDEDVPPQVKKKQKQNSRSTEAMKHETTQPKKPRGRPRKKPINESVDNLDGNLQALAVQFPEDSSKLLPTDGISQGTLEQVAKEDTETIQPKKPRGRPRKKPINDPVDNLDGNYKYVPALAVQFPEADGISQDTFEQVAKEDTARNWSGSSEGVSVKPQRNPRSSDTVNVKSSQPQKPRRRPRKKPLNESSDNLDGTNLFLQGLAVETPDDLSKSLPTDGIPQDTPEQVAKEDTSGNWNSTSDRVSAEQQQQNPRGTKTVNEKSTQPRKPRRKPRKRPLNESADDLDGSNQYLQALAVETPDDSSKSLPTDGIPQDTPEQVAKENTDGNWNGTRDGVSAEKRQQNPGVTKTANVKLSQPEKPRRRPRKKPINESVGNLDCRGKYVQALAVQLAEESSQMLPTDEVSSKTHEQVTEKNSGRKRKGSNLGVSKNSEFTASTSRRVKDTAWTKGHFYGTGLPLLTQNGETSNLIPGTSLSYGQDLVDSSENLANSGSFESSLDRCSIPTDVALPRVVFCLAHNGKVAWDVKWRPSDSYTKSKHTMGYLAVLLGNGALEVWEVPLPSAAKVIYSACQKEGNDPRFVKLEPVFRCSMVKCGDRQSIPLTVEWSASSPHDLILAGCHDGVVALWKFSANGPSKDTSPLLCFSADKVPIRALAWAPVKSDPESANIIVTAGHKGLKFWDIRDPFRPLWDLDPGRKIIYSLDWLPDPRCIILSCDDGTLKILSLLKAAYDVPVTGKPFVGTQQQGLHDYYCSSFTIWSVQVSRQTGMVAYCSADGTVLRFQLTTREVEKDPLRNRPPHFLCGSLTEEESALTVISPLPDIPFPMKKSLNKKGNAPRTKRGFSSVSNREKSAKEHIAIGQTSEEQPLALCYGDDPESEFQSDDTLMTQKSKQKPKTKSSSNKKLKTDQALTCRDEDPAILIWEEEIGSENEIEVFPPKIIAMHRVRWNMNKGSERWLCYGGAGGIVRCQEIDSSPA